MNYRYIFLINMLIVSTLSAAEARSDHSNLARRRPAPLDTSSTHKRLSAHSPRSANKTTPFASPRFQKLKSPRAATPLSNDSTASSPDDAASYTRTIVPDLDNRLQVSLRLLAQEIKSLQCTTDSSNADLKRVRALSMSTHTLYEELCSIKNAETTQFDVLDIVRHLKREKSVKLKSEEKDRVIQLIDFYEQKVKPQLLKLTAIYQSLQAKSNNATRDPKKVGSV